MPKVIEATCVAGIVTAGGAPLVGAVILSQGVGPSTGIAIIDQEKIYYVAKTTPDVKSVLEKLISTITELTTVLTLIDAKPTGGVASAVTPVAVASVINLTAINVQLTALNGILK